MDPRYTEAAHTCEAILSAAVDTHSEGLGEVSPSRRATCSRERAHNMSRAGGLIEKACSRSVC